jgi:uncharacterized protein (DUF1800 family)
MHERRVLDRLCYGVSPVEARRVASIGLRAWIEEQLSADGIPEVDLRWRMRNLDVLDKDADAIDGVHKKAEVIEQLRRGTLLRQIYSRRQIFENMVEFWNDHFNISVEKGPCWGLKVVDDREVIRKHALGSFHDLLSASAHSPAMLVYLDNQTNDKRAPNENYARELLELHTLGIDGGYTHADIVELARCLTGWSVRQHFWKGRFEFDKERHDQGNKHVLGMHIEAGGQRELEEIITRLSNHPSTARRIATKMARRFLCDDPESEHPEWVERLVQVFVVTRGSINAMLRKLLLDGVARDPLLLGKKVKRPVDFMVSSLRILGAESDGGIPLQRFLSRMGQPTFAWPMPDGPPDTASEWNSNLAPRWKFSLRLMAELIEGTKPGTIIPDLTNDPLPPSEILSQVSEYLLGYGLLGAVSNDLIDVVSAVQDMERRQLISAMLAGLLASPEFQYR